MNFDQKRMVKEVLSRLFLLDEDYIYDHSDLVDDLGLDSLDLIELQLELEKCFQIEISDDDIQRMNIKTVSDIYDAYDKLFA